MTIVNTIDITKEKPRYNKNGKSIIFSQKELTPSNTQSIVTAITLQRQNPTKSIPKNSRNKTNRPNHFLFFSFFICSPLLSCRKRSKAYGYCHKASVYIDMRQYLFFGFHTLTSANNLFR